MNSVANLLKCNFNEASFEDKLKIKALGRPIPNIEVVQSSIKNNKPYSRKFNSDLYRKHKWLCGCSKKKSLFCFPCLLFGGDTSWTKTGVTDLVHLSARIIKHEASACHINNEVNLAVLGGKANVETSLNSAIKKSIEHHNGRVKENRYIVDKILKAIKFCAKFGLSFGGSEDSVNSENSRVFKGLLDYSAESDPVLKVLLNKANVFTGTETKIKNELLSCSLDVCRNRISKEILQTSFVSAITYETTDLANEFQLALFFRYELNGNLKERFWGLFTPASRSAESIARVISEQINLAIQQSPEKLIALSYDGSLVTSGLTGAINVLLRNVFPNAHYVHCYAHQMNLIMTQSVSSIPEVGDFFSNLSLITNFVSDSSLGCTFLDEIVEQKLSRSVKTRWNFNIRPVNTVFNHRELLLECLEKIIKVTEQPETRIQARNLLRLLTDSIFVFWLTIFHHIMPRVDCFNNITQRSTDVNVIKPAVNELEREIKIIKSKIQMIILGMDKISDVFEVNFGDSRKAVVLQVCDIVIAQAKDRFSITSHLVAAKLFQSELYPRYRNLCPKGAIAETIAFYPFFNSVRLKTELKVLFCREDFSCHREPLASLNYIMENGLEIIFEETLKLLQILVTTPMKSIESGSFSRLERLKTALRNNASQDSLSSLTMLALESDMANNDNFSNEVIRLFSLQKERRMDFVYKTASKGFKDSSEFGADFLLAGGQPSENEASQKVSSDEIYIKEEDFTSSNESFLLSETPNPGIEEIDNLKMEVMDEEITDDSFALKPTSSGASEQWSKSDEMNFAEAGLVMGTNYSSNDAPVPSVPHAPPVHVSTTFIRGGRIAQNNNPASFPPVSSSTCNLLPKKNLTKKNLPKNSLPIEELNEPGDYGAFVNSMVTEMDLKQQVLAKFYIFKILDMGKNGKLTPMGVTL